MPSQDDPSLHLILADGGLDHFVLALPAFAALRRHHDSSQLTLWTTADVVPFAEAAPYFDTVEQMPEVPWRFGSDAKALRQRIAETGFATVYDLFPTTQTARLFALYEPLLPFLSRPPGPAWSGPYLAAQHSTLGLASGLHLEDRALSQLRAAGVEADGHADLSWVGSQIKGFTLPVSLDRHLVLIVCDETAPFWTISQTAAFCARAIELERTPVLVSLTGASPLAAEAKALCPAAVDLTGTGSVFDMVALAWAAEAAVGPDCGLMHLVARTGCRAALLFGPGSDPAVRRPKLKSASVLQRHDIGAITVTEVTRALKLSEPGRTPAAKDSNVTPFSPA